MTVSIRSDGGAEALLRTLFDELADSPYDFEVFTLRAVSDDNREDMTGRGIPTHEFDGRRLVGPRRFLRLLLAVRAGRFDVIHTNLPAATILGVLCGLVLRVPVIATLHNSETSADRHWYQGRLETLLLRRGATRVLAVGEMTADARREMLPGIDIHVLPNAVAPSPPLTPAERTSLRKSFMSDPSSPLVLTVGRLTKQKAHDDLINAWQRVQESWPGAELAIAGRGHLERDLEQLVEQLGLDDVVHFLGSRSDVRSLLRAADVFVLSSLWEGLPVALLEAMEAELPLVSTNVGDVPTVVSGGCVSLVESGNPEQLGAALCEMLALLPIDARRNGTIVEERYSSKSWARTMTQHYDAAIDDGGSARRATSPRWFSRRNRPRSVRN